MRVESNLEVDHETEQWSLRTLKSLFKKRGVGASAGGQQLRRGSGWFISFSTLPPTGPARNSTAWCGPDTLKRKTFRTIASRFFFFFFLQLPVY